MRKLLAAVMMVVSLFASACSTDATVTLGDDGLDGTAATSEVDEVPAALAFLGDLVESRGAPTVSPVDTSGGSVQLGEGASVVVADGAFAQTTEVTTQLLDIDFATTLGDRAPWSRAYVVSTVDDVDLGAPVAIEIPRPADGLRAVQIIDGEIVEVEVLGDSTSARIEIPHFSEIVTIVLRTWGPEAAEAVEAEMARLADTAAPAAFLITCIRVVAGVFSDEYSNPDEFGIDIAMGACANALIEHSSPDGKYVSPQCVRDRISGGLDFQPAVDACAADRNETDDGEDGDDATAAEDEPAVDERKAEPLPPDTQLVWTAMLERDELREPELMTVTRIAGTDEFMIETEGVSIPMPGNYREPGGLKRVECTALWTSSSWGTGTFDDDASHLVFAGDGMSQTIYIAGPCIDREPILGLNFRDLQLRIVPDGLEYDSPYDGVGFEILPGGPPRPVGQ